ncbi:ankyrin repeat-containing domain protein [Haematococcus lacustris]
MGNSLSSLEEQVYVAAASNDSATLQKLLDRVQNQQPVVNRRLLEFRDHDGRTPLIVAAARNHEHCVQLLLEHGASVHFMNYLAEAKGDTALHEAARNGDTHAPVCDLLLRYGANPFLANSVGRTPLEEAMQAGSFEIMDKMREKALWLGMVAVKVRGGRNA